MTPEQFDIFIKRFDLAVECIIISGFSNDGYNGDKKEALFRYKQKTQEQHP